MFDVAIIGGGPVGALAANLLGAHGLSVVVLERDSAPYPLPRAVHIDHEVMRLLQSVGLAETAWPTMRAAQGHLHVGADGQILRYLGTAGQMSRFGWPADLFFYQPEFEALLCDGLQRFSSVDLKRGTRVTGVAQGSDSVLLSTEGIEGASQVAARYAIACDGAASTVRKALGIPLIDLGFDEPWLVVDIETAAPICFPDYVGLPPDADLQHLSVMLCDPRRPTTVVPGRGAHRRWEFMLLPGEDEDAMRHPARVAELIAPWVGNAPYRLIRAATYHFHGLIAERWRDGRVFLAGDAAHQTPPFFGQGLCHGARDVANLAWKMAAIFAGTAPSALLNGYQHEREPQVRSVIAAAIETGRYICELDPMAAAERDIAIRRREAESPPRRAPDRIVSIQGLVRDGDPGAGARFVQPFVAHDGRRRLLDDATGNGARLVTRGGAPIPPVFAAAFGRVGGTIYRVGDDGLADCDGGFASWCDAQGVDAVLVRPDFYVFGTAPAGEEASLLSDWLRHVATDSSIDAVPAA